MEFEHLNKINRGERTLGQHLDRLIDLIGNFENVTNMMKRVPPLEEIVINMDNMVKNV